MTYEDNKEWISGSAREWVRSGVSVLARDPATGRIAGTLLATILTRKKSKPYDGMLMSPNIKVSK